MILSLEAGSVVNLNPYSNNSEIEEPSALLLSTRPFPHAVIAFMARYPRRTRTKMATDEGRAIPVVVKR